MPQMSPIMWTTMLLLTNLTIYQTMSTMMFSQKIKTKSNKKMMKKKKKIEW